MNRYFRKTVASISLAALAVGMTSPALALAGRTDGLKPVPISIDGKWLGHWAEKDLQSLRTSLNVLPEDLLSGVAYPDGAAPVSLVADALTCIYGVGGDQKSALDTSIALGLILPSDFGVEQIGPEQPVSRELFALLLARALGLNGAEGSGAVQTAPDFADVSEIQAAYRITVALLQSEGLMMGDGQGHFSPAEPVTYAQVARTMVRVSDWARNNVVERCGLNPADATYLIGGQRVTLTGGIAEQPAAPGSAIKAVTRLSDRQAAGDLNGDGQADVAVVLTHDGGGSGTFHYLAGVKHDGTPVGAVVLGDRIAVRDVRIANGKVVVDMLTRSAQDAMTVRPHSEEIRVFELKDGAFVQCGASLKEVAEISGLNPAEATYLIDDQKVTLAGGTAEEAAAPGSAIKTFTKLSDRLAAGDVDGDGQAEVAAVLTHDGGGSGAFYYLGVVDHSGTPVKAAFLGDRVNVLGVRVVGGKISVDMLTRNNDDAFSVKPHVEQTRVFEVKAGGLVPLGSSLDSNSIVSGFERYIPFIGKSKADLIKEIGEEPALVNEGGLNFQKAGIRAWLNGETGNVVDIYTSTNSIDFRGCRVGDSIGAFRKAFEAPETQDARIAYDTFLYEGVRLTVNYDPATMKVTVVHIAPLGSSSLEQVVGLSGMNPANATYLIGSQKVTLDDGTAEQAAAPGSAMRTVTKLSSILAAGDLDRDERADVAAVLTHDGGGSGTFYYLGVVDHSGTPVKAAFLGDRITVLDVRVDDNKISVEMLTRNDDDAFSVKPQVEETRVFELKDGAVAPCGS